MKAKKIKHVLNCLTPTQRKFAMPAAQDKIVYLYFICNCKLIVKSVAYVSLMFSCIVYLHESVNPLAAGMETQGRIQDLTRGGAQTGQVVGG